MSNLRDQILNAQDIESEVITVKQWGVKIKVQGLTGKARAGILKTCINQKTGEMDLEKLYTLLVIRCSFDPESGEQIFKEADMEAISGKSGGALEHIAKVASKLSGLEDGQLDESVKN